MERMEEGFLLFSDPSENKENNSNIDFGKEQKILNKYVDFAHLIVFIVILLTFGLFLMFPSSVTAVPTVLASSSSSLAPSTETIVIHSPDPTLASHPSSAIGSVEDSTSASEFSDTNAPPSDGASAPDVSNPTSSPSTSVIPSTSTVSPFTRRPIPAQLRRVVNLFPGKGMPDMMEILKKLSSHTKESRRYIFY